MNAHARFIRRARSGILVYSLACFFWFLFRTGTRPSRLTYPCQKAAASQSLVLVIVAPYVLRDAVRFLKQRFAWNAVLRSVLVVGLIGAITLLSSVAYDRALIVKEKIQLRKFSARLSTASVAGTALASPAMAALPSPDRVVMVHDDAASWWHSQSYDYWNMIDQAVIDTMVYRGLKELTGTASVAAAWQVLIPNYQPHQKIAIKINNNNAGYSSGNWGDPRDADIDAIIEPVNSIAKSLIEAFGPDIAAEDIWVYESKRCLFDSAFMDRAMSGIQFYSAIGGQPPSVNPTGFSGTAPGSVITFRYNPGLSLALNDVVADADYLIDMPILKRHGNFTYPSTTLSFKNHFGSIDTNAGWAFDESFHAARFLRTNNNLIDIYGNPHIRYKTVLIVGDAIIGGRDSNQGPPALWSTRFASEGTPEMLFFAVDPVAVDSVMADMLYWEAGREHVANTRNYLLEAADLGLGVEERSVWAGAAYPNVTITYQNIDFVHVSGVGAELTRIDLISPPNLANLSSSPTFTWMPDGGTGNVYVVDFYIPALPTLWTTPILLEATWGMPGWIWNLLPSGSPVFWRVRGADLDHEPLEVIVSDEVRLFYKE